MTLYDIHTVPPPPPIGGGFPGVPMKKAVVPNVPLPMLNWLPIRNPEHTIFKVYRPVHLFQRLHSLRCMYRISMMRQFWRQWISPNSRPCFK